MANGTRHHYDKSQEILEVVSYYLKTPDSTIDSVAEHFKMTRDYVLKILWKEARLRETFRGRMGDKIVDLITAKKEKDPTYRYSKVNTKYTLRKGTSGNIIEKEKGNSK